MAETNAIKAVFGGQAYHIPISSLKSIIGHPFAAASALQVVASCLTLQRGIIPPTINYDTPDPCCDLDYVPHSARRARTHRPGACARHGGHRFGGRAEEVGSCAGVTMELKLIATLPLWTINLALAG